MVFLIIVQLIPESIVRLFLSSNGSNPEDVAKTIGLGGAFMRCWSWCVIGMSLFNMYNSIFQAVGRWKTSLLLAVLRLGVIFCGFSFLLDALWGVTGLMWVQAITDTASCLIAVALYAQFKKSMAKSFAFFQPEAAAPITHRVITISREFGSGGRTIGKDVAARLGIPCYDSEIIEKIAVKTGFAKEYIEKYGEYAQSASLYDNALAGRTYDGQSDADKLWLAQKEVIHQAGPGRPLRDCRPLRRLHPPQYRKLPDGVHPRLGREAGGADCKRLWPAGGGPRPAAPGQGQKAEGIL